MTAATVTAEEPHGYTARHLSVLEGLEAVRKRPGMYIGSTDSRGLMHCLWEIIDNSVDEALGGHCTRVEVLLHADGSMEVRDDGRGIPVDTEPKTGLSGVELVMTRLHAGGKFGGISYTASGGLHGVGASVVNALSVRLDVEVDRDGHTHVMSFKRGLPGEFAGAEPTAKFTKKPARQQGLRQARRVAKRVTGTRVRFWPDRQIFLKGAEVGGDVVVDRMRQTAFLVPGLTVTVRDERDEEPVEHEFRFDGGISEFCEHLASDEAVCDVLRLQGRGHFTETVPVLDDQGHLTPTDVERDIDVDVALRWGTGYDTVTRSFVNVIATPKGGTHLAGFDRALVKVLNDQLRSTKLLKNGDEAIIKDDVLEGLTAVVTVRLPEPQFEGQTKEVLGTSAATRIVSQVVGRELKAAFDNPKRGQKQPLRTVLEKVVSASKARIAARQQRENQRRKSALENSSLPAKLVDCRTADDRSELFIVEGDSALGTAKLARDSEFQALLPIRGKILNVQKASIADMLKNVECASIIQVIGAGSGRSFDLDSARYGRVILMSVAPDEPVLFTDRDGRFTLRRIGPAVDAEITAAGLGELDGTVSVDLTEHSTRVSPVKQFIRHRHRGMMFKIRTAYGRSVAVTGGHSVFTYEREALTLKPASELRVGDLVVAPRQLPRPAPQPEIDLAVLLKRAGQDHAVRIEGEAVRRLLASKLAARQPAELRRHDASAPAAAWLAELDDADLAWLAGEPDGREIMIYPRAHRHDAIPRHLRVTEDLCYILGWYTAEGSLGSRGSRLSFSLGADDRPYIQGLCDAIERVMGREVVLVRPSDRPNSLHLYVHAPLFARLVAAIGLGAGAREKRVPDLLLNCTEEQQLAFLEGYFLGDGTKDARGRKIVFGTSSRQLADGLLCVLGQLGVLAGISEKGARTFRIRGENVHTGPSYSIAVTAKDGLSRLSRLWRQAPCAEAYRRHLATGGLPPRYERISETLVALPIREITPFEYDGDVYDLSVPEDENFISGTGGLLTHNTDADVDGAHIRTLLLTLLYRYMFPMVRAGRVFAAVPPLHRIELTNPKKGQQKYVYTYSDGELRKKLVELERRKVRWKEPIQRYKGLGEMDADQLAETTMDPRHRMLRRIRIVDAEDAERIFSLLMGSEVGPRREFISGGAAELDDSRIDI